MTIIRMMTTKIPIIPPMYGMPSPPSLASYTCRIFVTHSYTCLDTKKARTVTLPPEG